MRALQNLVLYSGLGALGSYAFARVLSPSLVSLIEADLGQKADVVTGKSLAFPRGDRPVLLGRIQGQRGMVAGYRTTTYVDAVVGWEPTGDAAFLIRFQ